MLHADMQYSCKKRKKKCRPHFQRVTCVYKIDHSHIHKFSHFMTHWMESAFAKFSKKFSGGSTFEMNQLAFFGAFLASPAVTQVISLLALLVQQHKYCCQGSVPDESVGLSRSFLGLRRKVALAAAASVFVRLYQ